MPSFATTVAVTSPQEIAAQAAVELEQASAHQIIEWAADTFGERLIVTSSMGDGLLAHLCAEVIPGVPVLFLDTGYHFAETLGTRDAVAARDNVQVRTALPLLTVAEQDQRYGPRLFERDPDACCRMRKVEVLDRALTEVDAWISGLRRDESPTRAATPVVGLDARRGKVKVHPIARWTHQQAQDYLARNNIPVNPLVADGYASIGCAPCTRAVSPGEDPRAGRWAGFAKTECGLHG